MEINMDHKRVRELQLKIMMGEPLSETDKKCLHESPECQEFKAIINNMNEYDDDIAPPAPIDLDILDFAKTNVPQKQKPTPILYLVFAAAAMIVIAIALLPFLQETERASEQEIGKKHSKQHDPMAAEEKKLIYKKTQLADLDINTIDSELSTIENELDMLDLDSSLDDYLTFIEE